MNPQLFGPLMDRLYAAGALEVFYVPVQMKKNRPGTLVTVLVAATGRDARLTDVLFRETTTIGVRYAEWHRECLTREIVPVETAYGSVRIKVARRGGDGHERAAGIRRLCRPCDGARRGRRRTCTLRRLKAWLDRSQRLIHAFLSDDRDRLREQPAAPGDRLREDHRRRHRPLQAAVRRRDALPDGQRRALAERVPPRPRARARSACLLRSDGAGLSRGLVEALHLVRRLHPHDRAAPSRRRAADGTGVLRRRRHLRGALRGLVLRLVRGVQAGKGSGRREVSDPPDQAGLDPREELLLPAVEVPAAAAASTTPRIPSSSSRRSGATRSCASSKAAWRTSRSAAPVRPGASRCRSIRRASSTSGSTR